MMTCILGVDPGISGALAFYYLDKRDGVIVEDMPLVDGTISSVLLAQLIKDHAPSIAMVENVTGNAGGKVGSKQSMFTFGRAFGQVLGVLGALQIEMHLETPAKWKAYFRLGKDKEESRKRAIDRFPASAAKYFARKADHNRAEAALIARYAAETLFPWSASQ